MTETLLATNAVTVNKTAATTVTYAKLNLTDGNIPQAKVNSLVSDLSGKVATSVTVNGHALTSNVTVTKTDLSLNNVDNVQQLPASYLSTEIDLDDGSGASNTKVSSWLAVKTYVDTGLGAKMASLVWAKENLTLTYRGYTTQYIDLAQLIKASSLDVVISGLVQTEGVDYTLSTEGGKIHYFCRRSPYGRKRSTCGRNISRCKYCLLII